MGLCFPCLGGQSDDYDQPSPETKRRQQAAAAEQRQKATEGRGLKDPENVKRKQQKREEAERKANSQPQGEGGLKWQMG